MRFANYIFWKNFLSEQECDKIVEENQTGLKDASIGWGDDERISIDRKTNVRFIEQNSPTLPLIEKVIDRISFTAQKYYGCSLKTFEMQYAEYEKGMFYSWHVDSVTGLDQIKLCTRDISASLILNKQTEYTGSSLQFILAGSVSPDNILTPEDAINQEQGTLIVFPSSTIHQVTKVTSGIRKSLVLWAAS